MSIMTWLAASVYFLISPIAAVAGVDLICTDSDDTEGYFHVKIENANAIIRYVGLGEGKNEELDYVYKKANDSTQEYPLRESKRYFYWYDLSGAQEYFLEPENITFEELFQKFLSANTVWEALEKESNVSGTFANASHMILIDRSSPALYDVWDVRLSSSDPIISTQERFCKIVTGDEAKDFMDSKSSDFKAVESDSIKNQEADAETKF